MTADRSPPPSYYPSTPKQRRTNLIVALVVGGFFIFMCAGTGLYQWHNYSALSGICRTAVLQEVDRRLTDVRNESTSITTYVTDIEVSEPIYDNPFKATVPAKFSAQMNASLFSRDTSVPLQCNGTFTGTWHVTVSNAVK